MVTENKRIDQYIDEHFDELVSTVQTLIRIPSYYSEPKEGMPYGEKSAEVLNKTLSICESFGFKTRNFDNYLGTATYGENPELGILFHLDVVPEGDGWTFPPYEGVIHDGRMYGRGTMDDKGPGVASIFALRAIKDLGIPLKKGVRLLMGTGEERGDFADLKYYLEHETMPSNVFTSDASFPVINVEKGILHYPFFANFVNKNHERAVLEIRGSRAVNRIPSNVTAVIKGFSIEELSAVAKKEVPTIDFSFEDHPDGVKIIAEGTAAHAAFPDRGNNPLTGLLKMLLSLPFDECEGLDYLRAVYEFFPHGDYLGKTFGIAAADGERSGNLTVSFTTLEYTADSLFGKLDIRLPVICTCEETIAALNVKMEKAGFKMGDGLVTENPHIVPEESEFVQGLIEVYRDYTGEDVGCEYTGGGTYVHDIDGGVAFGCTFPGHPDNRLHGTDEFIGLDELKDQAKIYARAIVKICG